MASSNVSLIIPLVEAQPTRRAGRKAIDLSRLIAAHFAVPKGFVISADAYRSHLWASGAREIASTAAEAEDREKIREAIMSAEVPDDVWHAILDAYQRLALQLGFQDPAVAVRSSAMEDGLAQVSFPGAYESILNVSGQDALKAAIKRVWASLWGGKAAAFRARHAISAEPAMAIIVQQMMDGQWSGTALSADPVTGNRNRVIVSCSSPASNDLSCYVVDMHTPSVIASGDDPAVSPGEKIITMLAEKAIVVEKTLGCPIELEWTYDRDRLCILQARPMKDLPPYFPEESECEGIWKRLTSQPISYFARESLLTSERLRIVNGYAYAQQSDNALTVGKQMAEGFRLLEDWQTKTGKSFITSIENYDKVESSGLIGHAARLAGDVRSLLDWTANARHYGFLFTEQIRQIDDSIANRLLGGLSGGAIMRDAHLQELADQFCFADKSGKVDEASWRKSYKADVEKFARSYGYSFTSLGEVCDPSCWQSWAENNDIVFRMIAAIKRRENRPSLITLHCAAEDDFHQAESEVEKAIGSAKRTGFEKTLRLARGWLSLGNDCEIALGVASTALRLAILELGRKLASASIIADKRDVFHLSLAEIAELGNASEKETAALVAQRKHDIWLEQRLSAPEYLHSETSVRGPQASAITGTGVCPGTVTGRARIARSIEDAGEIECGEILVVESATLAWTPFLAAAVGLVAQGECLQPGVESIIHTYGIPAITGCRGALDTLNNGEYVTLDASAGVVEVNTQPSAARSL